MPATPRPTCPKCNGPMKIRKPRKGATFEPFYGCTNYPVCDGTRNLDGSARLEPGKSAPKPPCWGHFDGDPATCSSCLVSRRCADASDNTMPFCPRCGRRMAKRESIRGTFYGCTDYPRCKGTRNEARPGAAAPAVTRAPVRRAVGADPDRAFDEAIAAADRADAERAAKAKASRDDGPPSPAPRIWPAPPSPAAPAGDLTLEDMEAIRVALVSGRPGARIEAIKVCRQRTGWGLREAKEAVDVILSKITASPVPPPFVPPPVSAPTPTPSKGVSLDELRARFQRPRR